MNRSISHDAKGQDNTGARASDQLLLLTVEQSADDGARNFEIWKVCLKFVTAEFRGPHQKLNGSNCRFSAFNYDYVNFINFGNLNLGAFHQEAPSRVVGSGVKFRMF